MPKKQVKITVPPRRKLGQKKYKPILQRQRPIRNKNFGLIRGTIVKNIKRSKIQEDLEESLRNKDFTKYNELLNKKANQDQRITLDNQLKAITTLKQKFQNIVNEVQEYDPNNELVDKIEKEGLEFVKVLDDMFNRFVKLRPKINNLTGPDKVDYDRLSRDIETYSVDLAKMEALVKNRLEGKEEKPSVDKLRDLKEEKSYSQQKKKVEIGVKDIEKYGVTATPDMVKFRELIQDPKNQKVVEDIIRQKMVEYNTQIQALGSIIVQANDLYNDPLIQNNKAKLGKKAGFPYSNAEINAFTGRINNVDLQFQKIMKDINKAYNNINLTDPNQIYGFFQLEQLLANIKPVITDLLKDVKQLYDEFDAYINAKLVQLINLAQQAVDDINNGWLIQIKKIIFDLGKLSRKFTAFYTELNNLNQTNLGINQKIMDSITDANGKKIDITRELSGDKLKYKDSTNAIKDLVIGKNKKINLIAFYRAWNNYAEVIITELRKFEQGFNDVEKALQIAINARDEAQLKKLLRQDYNDMVDAYQLEAYDNTLNYIDYIGLYNQILSIMPQQALQKAQVKIKQGASKKKRQSIGFNTP